MDDAGRIYSRSLEGVPRPFLVEDGWHVESSAVDGADSNIRTRFVIQRYQVPGSILCS
jgi:hypothetical protein